MTLSPAHLDLKALAEKATPGPWGEIGHPYYEYWIVEKHEADAPAPRQVHPIASVESAPCKYADGWYKNTQRSDNAAYIAAAHPQAILYLLRELDEARAALKAAAEFYERAEKAHDEQRSLASMYQMNYGAQRKLNVDKTHEHNKLIGDLAATVAELSRIREAVTRERIMPIVKFHGVNDFAACADAIRAAIFPGEDGKHD